MKEHDRSILLDIQEQTMEVLRDVIGGDHEGAVLLDYPRHKNAGDALIYAGEREYLARLGFERPYTVDIGRFDFERMKPAMAGNVVLFHGGGNLGDIWPEYQEFREALIPRLHGTKIVILAQSTWFGDANKAKQANRAFAAHGDVTILLRESESFERAATYFPDVRRVLCPDMAFGNAPFSRLGDATNSFVFLSRDDHEKAASDQSHTMPPLGSPTDWESGMASTDQVAWWRLKLPGIVYKRVPALRAVLESALMRSQEGMCDLNLRSAVKIISAGEVLITDRLHAHVFAALLGIPHVVLDNNYGKIRSVFREYSGRFGTANFATTREEASSVATTLLHSVWE